MASCIRVALVGAGRMGQIRAGIMQRSDRFVVVVVVDPMDTGAKLATALGAQHERSLEAALSNGANGAIGSKNGVSL